VGIIALLAALGTHALTLHNSSTTVPTTFHSLLGIFDLGSMKALLINLIIACILAWTIESADAFAAGRKGKKGAVIGKGFGAIPTQPTLEEVVAKFPNRIPNNAEECECPCGSGKVYKNCCGPFHKKREVSWFSDRCFAYALHCLCGKLSFVFLQVPCIDEVLHMGTQYFTFYKYSGVFHYTSSKQHIQCAVITKRIRWRGQRSLVEMACLIPMNSSV
jgi:hypothetical protein